jgi:hypothetical protein
MVGQTIELFEDYSLTEGPSQQSRLHTNSIANRHIWRLHRKQIQALPLYRLDEVVASTIRQVTMHFNFDLVSLTLGRRRNRPHTALNHCLIRLGQHIQTKSLGPVNVSSIGSQQISPA